MDLEGIMLNEMSDREIQILNDLSYMWNLKKNDHRYREQTSGCQSWKVRSKRNG